MKTTAIASVVIGVLVLAAIASAGVKHYPTTLTVTGTAGSPPVSNEFIEFGQVHSAKKACRSGRKMKMYASYPDGSRKLLDTGRSSAKGAYALIGDFTDASGGIIKAAPKHLGPHSHKIVCNAGSVGVD
jgi:hypothetical protein